MSDYDLESGGGRHLYPPQASPILTKDRLESALRKISKAKVLRVGYGAYLNPPRDPWRLDITVCSNRQVVAEIYWDASQLEFWADLQRGASDQEREMVEKIIAAMNS